MQIDNKTINMNTFTINIFDKRNLSRYILTPIEEMFSIEITCGLKIMKDKSYLSWFGLFDKNVSAIYRQIVETG